MRKSVTLLFILFSILASSVSYAKPSRTQYLNIPAPALEASKLNTATEQSIYVYLPPSYFVSDKKYPVVYYLHGFQAGPFEARAISGNTLDNYSAENQIQEMIIVGVTGSNSFYTNSPITGNWEDFVTTDVLNYVDNNFRTLAAASNRGIVGFSMGGFAAINIAFRHPDKFKHVFSLSPGLFAPTGLAKAVNQWQQQGWTPVLDAYAAAFAPNPNSKDGKLWHEWDASDPAVVKMWQSGYGDIDQKIEAYLLKPDKLTSIYVEYGSEDSFQWIPEGSRYLVQALSSKGVNVGEYDHGSGHVITYLQAEHIIDFFGHAFSREK
ncbi:putative esterase [Vibrio sp. N418]|uniref:alpha/beta hydrolase n=1 Tax=Vibrio sp. (strain N418) TaxID=701176 RepID=UPI00021BECC2|nr:alpha/beta fold hydrolase [Vibrio sp. N418]EGU34358.1 putative esterase [Vibrio sp. N418]